VVRIENSIILDLLSIRITPPLPSSFIIFLLGIDNSYSSRKDTELDRILGKVVERDWESWR
jgi:hypothetical protein